MKYVLMFTSQPGLDATVEPALAKEVYGRMYQWFVDNADKIAEQGAELQPVETATTVKTGGVVVDGPFNEAKEVIGGFTVIDVPDLDAAIALAKTWPGIELPGVAIEIRPPVVDYSQFD
jgi:hypothetical protein